MELRRQIERVAAKRRALPAGGDLKEDYVFEAAGKDGKPTRVPPEPGQEYRHNDLLDPVWNVFDLAPEGRGDFQPKLSYR
jgi:predicted dithiol-disulfide oxidoreductase (DUF899 family)